MVDGGKRVPRGDRIRDRLLRPRWHVVSIVLTWVLFVLAEWYLAGATTAVEYGFFALSSVAFVPFALLLTNFGYHFLYEGETLPRRSLDEGSTPRVAVCYTTYNDVIPLCLEQTAAAVEYPVDRWILTDSDDPAAIESEKTFGAWRRYTRETGRGGKCGIINDWLADHGDEYDYFLTLDADTMLAEGNVTRLVEHAEHPDNAGIGIFQSLKEVHPDLASTPFARIVGRGVKWSTRISPMVMKSVYRQNTYWGSGGLIRTDAVRDAGGYDERLICEDFVLTVKLDRAGWRTLVVDDRSYEGFPLDLHALRVRTVRWVRANRQMLPLLTERGVSAGTRLNVLTPVLFYAVTPVLLSLVVLAALFPRFGDGSLAALAFAAGVFAFIFLHRSVAAPGQFRAFLETAVLETLVVLGLSLRVSGALLFGRFEWVPSRKVTRSFDWPASLRQTLPEVAFGLLLVAVAALRDPTGGLVAVVGLWAVSFLAAPVILRYTSRSHAETSPRVTLHDPQRSTDEPAGE